MMTGLREHFATQADQAKYYDVANSVIRVARRRQRLVRLAPVGVAVAAVLAVVAAWAPLAGGSGGGGLPGIDAAGPADTLDVDWIPERWDVPDSAPPLPADRPVGAGALVHAPCATLDESCRTFFLLTRDGAQYKVDGGGRASLSPDGRWLVSGRDSARTLRDLTGTMSRPLPDGTVVAWSPTAGWSWWSQTCPAPTRRA
ncbi:hypothetical protein Prum_068850 [Phytohabitans rumicis]|uniref:Uncharacterized protein n=2 Tax=Phytohabitans rumicis TaxID=1076125 RepID=A0A6V8L7K9_9ACTN|nr:hypothetical protein Prum_068850 [Phytohabitans rumicis]